MASVANAPRFEGRRSGVGDETVQPQRSGAMGIGLGGRSYRAPAARAGSNGSSIREKTSSAFLTSVRISTLSAINKAVAVLLNAAWILREVLDCGRPLPLWVA